MVYILVNKAAAQSGSKDDAVQKAAAYFEGKEVTVRTIQEIGTYPAFFASIDPADEVVLVGGDGTVNVLACQMDGIAIHNPVYLIKAGTGNDFLRDRMDAEAPDGTVMQINEFIRDLPTVTVQGKTYRFLNNVGFGIDGKVCTAGLDKQAAGETNINYSALAIKLMLTSFQPADVKVKVDGKEYTFRKAWLAPAMNGRYYGGGLKMAPDQDRTSDTLSLVVFHGTGRIRTLLIFSKVGKGGHVKYKKNITVLTGHHIEVEYAVPQDLQIDGEVIRDVTSYTADKPAVSVAGGERHEEAATV